MWSLVTYALAFALVGVTTFVVYFKWCLSYWERKGVAAYPGRIPVGSHIKGYSVAMQIYTYYHYLKKKGVKYGGFYMFNRPIFMPVDPDLVKAVTVRDFKHFIDRDFYYNEEKDPLGAHMLAIEGDKWKLLRRKSTPAFTTGKLKSFFGLLQVTCDHVCEVIENHLDLGSGPMNVEQLFPRYTLEFNISCAFGIDSNCVRDPDAPELTALLEYFNVTPWRNILLLIGHNYPNLARFLGIRSIPKHISDHIFKIINGNQKYREETGFVRKDFLQIMLDLKRNPIPGEKPLTDLEIAAQAFVFLAAAYETTSTAMNFCFYRLSKHQDIQDRLREEVTRVMDQHGGKMTYEAMAEMPYLDQVLSETLRLDSPAPILARWCTEDYPIPGTDVVIEKGTEMIIPVIGLHRDDDNFPDALTYNPDRFSEENRAQIKPGTYLPFGDGPRNCIGLRQGQQTAKFGIGNLVYRYKFKLNSQTIEPVKLKKEFFINRVDTPLWMDIERVQH